MQLSNMIPYVTTILLVAFIGVIAGHPGRHGNCTNNLTVSPEECCNIPSLANVSVVEKCRSEFPFKKEHGREGEKRTHHGGSCVAQCILTAMGAYRNDKLDREGFKKAIQGVIATNAAFKTVTGQVIDECYTASQVDPGFLVDGGAKKSADTPSCSVIPKLFVNCVYSTLYQKCPSVAWNESNECFALKDRLKQGCPYFALRKHHKQGR